MKNNRVQFKLRTLLGGLALLSASHMIYWKRTITPWCRSEVSDCVEKGYVCEIKKRNLFGDEYICTLFAHDTWDTPKINEIRLVHNSAPLYFWSSNIFERHDALPKYCVLALASGKTCTQQKHNSILHWFEKGNKELTAYLAEKK